jgi:alkanesulfonate monooxygenase SsuD/methylene tetrahydromethanopterin reductase-like flavin-dependent oxidoreductase (luciferase family)
MRFGLQMNSRHSAVENIRRRLEELLEYVRRAQAGGFHPTVALRLYLPALFQMLPPLPLLADMAAEADRMCLVAGIVLLLRQHPAALAADVGTRDAICNGRGT